MSEEQNTAAEVIRDLSHFRTGDINGTPFVSTPIGAKIELKPELRDKPIRAEQDVKAHDVLGFIAYVNRFKESNTVVFAALDPAPALVAIVDYHAPNGDPAFCKHRVGCSMPRSEEWKRWTAANNERFTQKQFGEFLTDNLADVVTPEGGKLLSTALNLSSLRNVEFRSSQRLSDGTISFSYTEDEKASTDARLPEKIEIGVPVFKGGDRYKVSARLRYTIKEGSLSLWYELERPDLVVDQAYSDTIDKVATQTSLPVIRGAAQ